MLYFKPSEFNCRCGCGMGLKDMDTQFIARLDMARSISKHPFVLTSSMRCGTYNAAVGGVDESSHTKGHAVDIEVSSSKARFKIIYGLVKAGFNRIGISENFIHVDNDPEKPQNVIWMYK